jgi:hypothetical protein
VPADVLETMEEELTRDVEKRYTDPVASPISAPDGSEDLEQAVDGSGDWREW